MVAALALGGCLLQRRRAGGQQLGPLARHVARRVGQGHVAVADDRRADGEAVGVALDQRARLQPLLAVGADEHREHLAVVVGVEGDGQLFADLHARHVAHVPESPTAAELHLLELVDLAQLVGGREQLAPHVHGGGGAQLLGGDLHPLHGPRLAVATMHRPGVEAVGPDLGAGVQLGQAGWAVRTELALETHLDQVLSVLDLALGAGVAGRVDDQLDAQTAHQVLEGGGHAAAGVDHELKRHAVHGVAALLVHGPQKELGKVGLALAAQEVAHLQRAAGVIGDDEAGDALARHALEVLWLVLVEHVGRHVPRAVVVQVEQRAHRGVHLPGVIGVRRALLLRSRQAAQLLGVQAIAAQRAGHGACRQRQHLPGIGVDAGGADQAVGAQVLERLVHVDAALAIAAKVLLQVGGQHLGLRARQRELARVGAALALRAHRHAVQAAQQRGAADAQAGGGGVVHGRLATMRGSMGGAGYINQLFDHGGAQLSHKNRRLRLRGGRRQLFIQ